MRVPSQEDTHEMTITWKTVCEILSELPGAAPDPPGGREVVRVKDKVIAYPAANERSRPEGYAADEDFVVVKVDLTDREALVHQAPQTFFVTPHYRNYPGVIVRLSTVEPEHLRELLIDAWRSVAPKKVVREWEEKVSV